MPHNAITDLLPAYLNGTLRHPEAWQVRTHLEICPECRLALRAWEGIADSEKARRVAVQPSHDLLTGAWAVIAAATPAAASPRSRVRHVTQVVVRQVRLMRPLVWIASASAIVLAMYVAAEQPGHDAGELLLAYALPLIAATGVGFVTDPEADPLAEITHATPTPPHLIFLCRWGLLYGFDLALSLAGSVLLAASSHQEIWHITALWVGPMALLAALSALLTILFGPFVAAGGALALGLGRAITFADGLTLQLVSDPFWTTNPPVVLAALALLGLALFAAQRRERFGLSR